MAADVVVKDGECIATLAERYGHFIPTIWDHPRNAQLKRLRQSPYVLLPGDVVFVPDLRRRDEQGATGKRHCFRRRGVPEKFRLQLLDDEQPIADTPYVFEIAGERREHRTDGEGWVQEWIPPAATSATLTFTPPEQPDDPKGRTVEPRTYEIRLGALDPPDVESGARARLQALSFLDAEDDDAEAYELAIATLQAEHELEITGALDTPTSALLHELYGS